MLTPNRFQHRSDGTTVIFLRHRRRTKICTIWTKDYRKVKEHHWVVCAEPSAKTFYAVNGDGVPMHRLLLPDCSQVDHKNHNGLDNRIYSRKDGGNIRPSDPVRNAQNKRKTLSPTYSRFKGVSFQHNRWRARITYHGRQIWLGDFTREVEAGKAYDSAARDYFGQFALLNFNKPSCRRGRNRL